MQIEWTIKKKRGNLRPELHYSICLEAHEKALALSPMRVPSAIPAPVDAWQEYCYPGQLERGDGPPVQFHSLEIPSHMGRVWAQSLRLPWRDSNEYPEVEASFILLRAVFEENLAAAYASQPMDEKGKLVSSQAVKEHIAPAVLAERFLRIAERGHQNGK